MNVVQTAMSLSQFYWIYSVGDGWRPVNNDNDITVMFAVALTRAKWID